MQFPQSTSLTQLTTAHISQQPFTQSHSKYTRFFAYDRWKYCQSELRWAKLTFCMSFSVYSPKQEAAQFSHPSRYATMDTSTITHLGSSKQVSLAHSQEIAYFLVFTGNSILPCCKIRWIDFYTDISLYIHKLCISVWIIVVDNHYSLLSLQCPLQAWWTNAQERELPRQLSNSSAWYLCFSVTLVTCQHGEPTEAALPLDSVTNED